MRRAVPLIGWVLLVGLGLGCEDEAPCTQEHCLEPPPDAGAPADLGPPDASAPDLGPADIGPPDAGFVDAGFPFREASCASSGPRSSTGRCQPACPPSGLCVSTETESFCVDRCAEDPSACLSGFSCLGVGSEELCIPPAASCLMEGATFGTLCTGDATACAPLRSTCQGDRLGFGYCTDPCPEGACPEGYRCDLGDDGTPVCLAAFGSPREHCGQESRDEEELCAWDGDCALSSCIQPPNGGIGVCGMEAPRDGGCPEGWMARFDGEGKAVCLPERCSCMGLPSAGPEADLFSEALASIGLDRCSLSLSVHDWVALPSDVLGDPYRLSFTNDLISEPWRAPGFAKTTVLRLEEAGADPAPVAGARGLLEVMAELADHPARTTPPGPIDPASPLASAVIELISLTGGTPSPALIRADAATVPIDLQIAVAGIVDGVRRAWLARQEAFQQASSADVRLLFQRGAAFLVPSADGRGLDPTDPAVQSLLNGGIDYGRLFGGAVDVVDAIAMADLGRFAIEVAGPVETATASFLFSQNTPIGRIAIGDQGSGIYDERWLGFDGSWALLVDLGGNDEYRIAAGGNLTAQNPVSVLIDLAGEDLYGYVESPDPVLDQGRLGSDSDGRLQPSENFGPISLSDRARQGAGRAGIGVLVDLGNGDDVYRSLRMSQGVGILGVGVLVDEAGDDEYHAEQLAQGAAMFGLGLFLDLDGNDLRTAYQAAQGFGYARGVGLSFDQAGDDQYHLDLGDPALGGDPLYPAAQRPEASNASLGQGFGYGRRADMSDRAFMSGGVGLLLDGSGNDRYQASILAQGSGFWFGAGILADRSGNDRYDGLWYASASGAHMALGLLLEGSGQDVYGAEFPGINVTLGGAHDYSVAFLIDDDGDDLYFGSRITLGSGNSAGRAFLIDNRGSDHYAASNLYSMGSAGLLDPAESFEGSPKRRIDSVGLFLDASGSDVYERRGTVDPLAKDDSAWLQSMSATIAVNRVELGVGLDGQGESSVHAPWSAGE